MVCRNLDVATRVARTDGFDCITLEGWRDMSYLACHKIIIVVLTSCSY